MFEQNNNNEYLEEEDSYYKPKFGSEQGSEYSGIDFIADLNTAEGKCWGVFGDQNDLDAGLGKAIRDKYQKTLFEFSFDCNNNN